MNAQVLIEVAGFVPVAVQDANEPEEPTLAAALALGGTAGRDAAPETTALLDRFDATASDLWLRPPGAPGDSSPGDIEAGALRPLSPDEMMLMAGGANSDMNGDDDYPWEWHNPTVIGPYWDWNFPPSDGGGGGGFGGGGDPPLPEPLPTPCVEASPEGVDLTEMNRAALAASNAIAALNDENIEYSSIIWSLNGTVGWTSPFTRGYDTDVNLLGGIGQVPSGAIIVGTVHNHFDDPGIDDRIPSGAGQENGEDWMAFDQIVNWNRDHSSVDDLPRGITVDPSMLMYIYTNQDHKTHVYDKTDKNQTTASCSLQ